MAILLDLLGATVVGSLLILTLVSYQGNVSEFAVLNNNERIVQQNLVSIVELLENDLRKIGYSRGGPQVPDPVLVHDSTRIKFLADINDNGTLDTVAYWLGSLGQIPYTPEHPFRILYRQVTSVDNVPAWTVGPVGSHLGVTKFRLDYYQADGATPAPPYQVIRVTLKIESPYALGDKYAVAVWQQKRVVARNVLR
ncbi:MAG: hypothetical protein COS95_00805 [Ignavibacteriales bacterium CG07_land_8_20_14_0_80_59_12]|nr:MAG: hypothetical protein COS95_00805 [Ignavibacteriales bacterium CG07_land_8_20_14_0_80_59_12]